MATSYKIRLKRFNGTDYDTLNLVSSNIIMDTGNSLQSDIVPATNGIIKNNNGVFETATLGSDYTAIDDTATSSSNKTWSIDKIKTSAGGALYFTSVAVSATTGNIVSKSDSAITSDHVLAECTFAKPSAITTNLTWTTSNGSVVLNGTCTSATTCNIVLVKKNN